MDHGADFVQYLPQLRRYARALTGNQDAGDQLVVAVLSRLGQKKHASDKGPKVLLFQLLSTLWNGLVGEQLRNEELSAGNAKPVDEKLGAMQELSRQAFLLIALDGFSHEDASNVLQLPLNEFEDILHTARTEVAGLVATNILIIEDEFLIAADLQRIVSELGHSVMGIAPTHAEAISLVKDEKPGLILADIKLADGSNGIDAVNEILAVHQVPVVFITAYPDSLLTGLRPEPTFLITKPFETDGVRAIVSQALFFNDKANPGASTAEQTSRLVANTK